MTNADALTLLLAEAARPASDRLTPNQLVKVQVALRQLSPALTVLRNEALVEAQKKPEERPFGISLVEELKRIGESLESTAPLAMTTEIGPSKWALKFPVRPAPQFGAYRDSGVASRDVEKAGPADAKFGLFVRKHLAEPHGAGRGGESVAINRSWYERLRDMALKAAQGAL